jgi:acetylornithine deacetylase
MLHFSASMLNRDLGYSTVIFGEPTELKLASGHKGIMRVDLTARGKAAHSGYPWLGRSANSMLIPALMVLDKLGDLAPEEGGLARSEKYGNSTVNVGLIRGGVAANVVAEHAEASVLIRLAGGTVEEAKEVVNRAVQGMGLEVDFSQGYGPVGLDADVEGFGVITVNYGTDVPNLKVKDGVKRYLYGPGSILVAHSDHEGLTVGDLEEAVEGYKRLTLHALGK